MLPCGVVQKGKIRIGPILILHRSTTLAPAGRLQRSAWRDLVAGVAGVERLWRGVGRPGVGALEPAAGRAGELGDLLADAGGVVGDDGADARQAAFWAPTTRYALVRAHHRTILEVCEMPHMRTYALSEQRQWRPQALRGTSRAVTPVYVVSTDVGAG